jgi:hypothetical protein
VRPVGHRRGVEREGEVVGSRPREVPGRGALRLAGRARHRRVVEEEPNLRRARFWRDEDVDRAADGPAVQRGRRRPVGRCARHELECRIAAGGRDQH